jgi:hypothetical protein
MRKRQAVRAAMRVLGWSSLTLILLVDAPTIAARAVELPDQYFRLMEAELLLIEKKLVTDPAADPRVLETQGRLLPGAALAGAVLFAKSHPANHSHGDRRMRDLAAKLGDLLAVECEQGRFRKILNSPWGTYLWLEAYRLLEQHDLGAERRQRWSRSLRIEVQDLFDQMAPRADFPRYQSPYIRTSTNHYSLWASTVYLAGRVFQNNEWERMGAWVMHRLATEEQTPDGYWGELTDHGPTTGYNALTLSGVGLYWEHSGDPAALEAIRRATDFHLAFTWPDGTPVETINGRNRHWNVSPWAHFAFSHSLEGRGYARFLTRSFQEGRLGEGGSGVAQTLGRIAQDALYYHEGPVTTIPQERPRYVHQMKVPAGIRKTGPWVVCLSGLIDPPVANQFMLDRQGHLSIYHEKLGLIVTGANSKHQPELATFREKTGGQTRHIPLSSRLRMSDQHDRLGLAYETFFAELVVPTPNGTTLPFQFTVIETNPNRMEDVTLTLQLGLTAGEVLETARSRSVLGASQLELRPDQIGGMVRHHGWTIRVDPSARLTWPVYPFNPYSNVPETDLRYAVGALSLPVKAQRPAEGALSWRRQEIRFEVEVP